MRTNVDVTFHPSWWHRHAGVDFDEKFFFDPDYHFEIGKGIVLREGSDVTIIAQAPKMAVHEPQMVSNIAEDLGIDRNRVSVKATTTEHLGFTGRGEGIACEAVVLIADGGENV